MRASSEQTSNMKIRFERKETKKVWPQFPFLVTNKNGSVFAVTGEESFMIRLYCSGMELFDTWSNQMNRDEKYSLYTGTITIQND
jgi:hypothetical protein